MKAANIREKLGAPSTGAAALSVGALLVITVGFLRCCPLRQEAAYASAAALLLAAFGIAADWKWPWWIGRVLAWLNAILFSILVVPDPEEALFKDAYGLNHICGLVALYFILCGLALGLGRKPVR